MLNKFLLSGMFCLLFINLSMAEQKHSPFHNKRVMVLGDSITKVGLYYRYMDYYLQKNFPKDKIDIIGIGLGSETASGLSEKKHPFPRPCIHERVGRALEQIKPDIVSICYGMNDGIYHPFSSERFTAYQKGILSLINKIKGTGAEVIVLTPPPFDPHSIPSRKTLLKEGAADYSFINIFYNYNDVLAKYGAWVKSLEIEGVTTYDIHTPLQKHLEKMRQGNPEYSLDGDGIHPHALGHLLMGRTLLKSMNLPHGELPLQEEAKLVNADLLWRRLRQKSGLLSKAWLDYIGYTRGEVVKSDSIDEALQTAADLQVQIDQLRK